MGKKLKILSAVFSVLLLCLVVAVFYRFTDQNHDRIEEQNRVYGACRSKTRNMPASGSARP